MKTDYVVPLSPDESSSISFIIILTILGSMFEISGRASRVEFLSCPPCPLLRCAAAGSTEVKTWAFFLRLRRPIVRILASGPVYSCLARGAGRHP